MLRPLLPAMSAVAARWIREQRDRFRPDTEPLNATQRSLLEHWFGPETLDAVRIARTTKLENPPSVPDFVSALVGQATILDMRNVGGVTYDDTVVINATLSPGVTPIRLLFHEMVHVAQYRLLGLEGFAEAYVGGWIEAGFVYRKIPLEEQAYSLETRFAAGTLGDVSVEEELRVANGV